jgi:hypothetical protein
MLRQSRHTAIVALVLSGVFNPVQADAPVDPLRLLPSNTAFFIKVEQPQKLVGLARSLATMKELEGFSNYREALQSTNFRRLQQFVGYIEKEMGYAWPELVEQLTGHGAVFAVYDAYQEKQQPAVLFVLQGKDERIVQKYYKLALDLLEQELTRQEAKEPIQKQTYRDVEGIKAGEFCACAIGATIIASNRENGIQAAVDACLAKESAAPAKDLQTKIAAARSLLPGGCLAWAWANLEPVKEQPGLKTLYDLPSIFPPFHVVAGGFGDVLRRSPYLTAALAEDEQGVFLTLRMPKGQNGMSEVDAAHAPAAGQPGVQPLLQPKGTFFSTSFYLDLYGLLWEHRDKLYPPEPSDLSLPKVEEFDKKAAQFLFGKRPSQLLQFAGTRHRAVVAKQFDSGYEINRTPPTPAFAWVMEMRDPDGFAKTIEPIIRAVGLLAGFGVDMKMVEEKHGDCKITGYRFAETEKNKNVNNGAVFNFSPCFCRVGKQMVFSSTLELARNLIEEVAKEGDSTPADSAALRSQFSWKGLALLLENNREALIVNAILQEGSTREEAKQQVDLLFTFLDKLGAIENSIRYEPERYQIEIRFTGKK